MGGGGQRLGSEGGGGDMSIALSRMFGKPSTVATGGYPRIGGIDIPPADMRDPFGRINNQFNDPAPTSWHNISSNGYWGGNWNPGTATGAPFGFGSGPVATQIPTFFDSSGYPFAVPVGGWNPQGLEHQGQNIKEV